MDLELICDDFGTKNLSNKFVKQPKINMNEQNFELR